MAKARKSADTLIIRGSGGAEFEVDDTPAIRDQIECGYVELVQGPKTGRKTAAPAEKPAAREGEGGSEDVASGLEDGGEKPAEGEAGQAG